MFTYCPNDYIMPTIWQMETTMILGSLLYLSFVAWYLFDDEAPATTNARSDSEEDYEDNLHWIDY